jgi:plasmid stabilization system protein ParE
MARLIVSLQAELDTAATIVEPYVVIYDVRDDTVRIVRVVDGRRNITRRLVRE